jgi:F-type H+-transporting ATPase subunit b
MISLDSSIIWAILIFLCLIAALNHLLFRPLLRVQDERESRTTGLIASTRKRLDHHLDLFNRYQAALKTGRLEGYRRQEELRSEAMRRRAEALDQARKKAEQMIEESRDRIRGQVDVAKGQLGRDAQDIARGIAASLLQRPA